MGKETKNVLTEEFLMELFNSAINNDYVCGVLIEQIDKSFLPDRDFQNLFDAISVYYGQHKSAPTFNIISQITSTNRGVSALLNDVKDTSDDVDPDIILEELQQYIIQVRFQQTYNEIGDMYSKHEHQHVQDALMKFANWYSTFSLSSSDFVDVVDTFESRFRHNREEHNEKDKKKPVTRFYIDDLDRMNQGRDLRTQLTCFLAATGVGKSHAARWIGKCALQIGGLNVLHFQLEGSEKEVMDAYSAALVNCNSYRYETGTLKDTELEHYMKIIKEISGTLRIKSYPKFDSQVSTTDIKNGITEYTKIYGFSPDVVIIDSMDLLTDSSGRRWTENGERHKRIAVASDLKDIAADENVWMVVTYQATIENRDWLNDEKNVLTEFNCAEAKGLSRPLTHLITLNQSDNERMEHTMRINVAKSRFFEKEKPFKIATNYENEQFYDAERTINLNRSAQ